jgi:hypothetical protein
MKHHPETTTKYPGAALHFRCGQSEGRAYTTVRDLCVLRTAFGLKRAHRYLDGKADHLTSRVRQPC